MNKAAAGCKTQPSPYRGRTISSGLRNQALLANRLLPTEANSSPTLPSASAIRDGGNDDQVETDPLNAVHGLPGCVGDGTVQFVLVHDNLLQANEERRLTHLGTGQAPNKGKKVQ